MPSSATDPQMQNPTTIALSRLMAQQRAMDVTAGNLANQGTLGYRAERTLFSDWLSRPSRTDSPPGGKEMAYVQDRATWRERQEGTMQRTGNQLDFAIAGDGYFTVETPSGTRLTRAGHFSLSADNRVVNEAGHALLDTQGRPLQLTTRDTELSVTPDGQLSSQNGAIGRIAIVRPNEPAKMQSEGATLLRADDGTQPMDRARLLQGTLEGSNVQPVQETTRMMAALREFQFTTQFVQAEADRRQQAIDKILPPRAG